MDDWNVSVSNGSAGDFHHRDLTAMDRPTLWVHRVDRPALVLGSSQHDDLVDLDAARRERVEVCRRRSGGGLVLVEPDTSCWIDVLIPPSDPRWSDDVNRAFHWVGATWLATLTSLGIDDLAVHTGGIEHADAGRFLCFAGLGPGEVVQRADGAVSKVVGLSQRRQRNVARFQGLLVTQTDLELTRRLVREDAWPSELDQLPIGIGLEESFDLGAVPDRFIDTVRSSDR